VFLRDRLGNTTTAASSPSASIVLDTTAPTGGTVTARPGNGQLALSWTGFVDAGTGVASYRVAGAPGSTAPARCDGPVVYAGTATTATIAGLGNGTAYSVRVCAVDAAGNLSAGATVSATPRSDTLPAGTFAINGGAKYTRSLTVSLALGATGDARPTQMCVSAEPTCTGFVAYAAAASYSFGPGEGPRTLRMWYRDAAGNTSAPATATITVDTLPPSGGTLTASSTAGKIALTWTAAADPGSGVAGYKLVGAIGTTAPAAGCTTGTTLATGSAMSFVHVVAARATWSYRLCATDGAGNVSPGIAKTATALGQ
jgi:hypothetical protein